MLSATSLPQPTVPLFPYTTLFRSGMMRDCLFYQLEQIANIFVFLTQRRAILNGSNTVCGDRGFLNAHKRSDRKSTRLNSSHPSISYAVFCLKKKKNDMTARLAELR